MMHSARLLGWLFGFALGIGDVRAWCPLGACSVASVVTNSVTENRVIYSFTTNDCRFTNDSTYDQAAGWTVSTYVIQSGEGSRGPDLLCERQYNADSRVACANLTAATWYTAVVVGPDDANQAAVTFRTRGNCKVSKLAANWTTGVVTWSCQAAGTVAIIIIKKAVVDADGIVTYPPANRTTFEGVSSPFRVPLPLGPYDAVQVDGSVPCSTNQNVVIYPTPAPVPTPSRAPSTVVTPTPLRVPTPSPSNSATPSASSSDQPTPCASQAPTPSPSDLPTALASALPSPTPSSLPTPSPSDVPSDSPTDPPTSTPSPSDLPTPSPSQLPTPSPSDMPSLSQVPAPPTPDSPTPSRSESATFSQSAQPSAPSDWSSLPSNTPAIAMVPTPAEETTFLSDDDSNYPSIGFATDVSINVTATCRGASISLERLECPNTASTLANYTFSHGLQDSSKYTDVAMGPSLAVTVTGLASGTTYDWRALACCPSGCWDLPSGTFTTGTPAAGPNVVVSAASDTSISLTVTTGGTCVGPDGSQSLYAFLREAAQGAPYRASRIVGGVATWTGLADGTAYIYAIRACCGNSDTCCSVRQATVTTVPRPSTPEMAQTVCLGTSKACVQWNTPTDPGCSASITYQWAVWNGLACQGATVTASSVTGASLCNGTGTCRKVSVQGLQPNGTYSWQVRACCGGLCSAYTTCSPLTTHPISNATATACGDPHLTTFDGTLFHVKSCGDFVLHRATNGNHGVYIRSSMRHGYVWAWIAAALIQCRSSTLSVYMTPDATLSLLLNDTTPTALPPTRYVWQSVGGGPFQVRPVSAVRFDVRCAFDPTFMVNVISRTPRGALDLEVKPSQLPEFADATEGLLGSPNQITSDDFIVGPRGYRGLPVGSEVALNVSDFAAANTWALSWQVDGPQSPFKTDTFKWESGSTACQNGAWALARPPTPVPSPSLVPQRRRMHSTASAVAASPSDTELAACTARCVAAVPELGTTAVRLCGLDVCWAGVALDQAAVLSLARGYLNILGGPGGFDVDPIVAPVSESGRRRRSLLSVNSVDRMGQTLIEITGNFPATVDRVYTSQIGGTQTEHHVVAQTTEQLVVQLAPLAQCGLVDVVVHSAAFARSISEAFFVKCGSIASVTVTRSGSNVTLVAHGTFSGTPRDVVDASFGKLQGTVIDQTESTVTTQFVVFANSLTRALKLESRALGPIQSGVLTV